MTRVPRQVLPILEVVLLIVLLMVPLATSDFHTTIASRMLLLAIFAISFDLCWGYSGIMSFGQALFFGLAGYVVALLANNAGYVQIWTVIPVSMLVGLIGSALVGWFLLLGKRAPTVIFVALGTLTASYTAERLVGGWQLVGAANGISVFDFIKIGSLELEPGPLFYYIILLILITVYLTSRMIVRSQLGLVLIGMRQNEERLAFLGYNVQYFKMLVFVFAGIIAGLSGGLYAFHEGFIGPGNLGIGQSTYAVLYSLFGGAGTLIGSVLGVAAIELMAFTLSDIDAFKPYWPVIIGVIMLLVVMLRPSGIMGFLITDRERIGSFGRQLKGTKQTASTNNDLLQSQEFDGSDGHS